MENELNISQEELDLYLETLNEWKEMYGDEIYVIEMTENDTFIYRALSKAEFDHALFNIEDIYEREEYICDVAVLDPEGYDFSNKKENNFGPMISRLAEEIVTNSGFNIEVDVLDKIIEEKKAQMNIFTNQILCIIHEVFPEYTIDDINNWTFDKILTYYGKATWVMENLRGVTLIKQDEQ